MYRAVRRTHCVKYLVCLILHKQNPFVIYINQTTIFWTCTQLLIYIYINQVKSHTFRGMNIRSVLTQVDSLNFNQIWLRSDFQGLVTAINTNRRSKKLFGVLSNVESFISSAFSFVSISYISRRFKGPVDSLAKACLCTNSIMGF